MKYEYIAKSIHWQLLEKELNELGNNGFKLMRVDREQIGNELSNYFFVVLMKEKELQ